MSCGADAVRIQIRYKLLEFGSGEVREVGAERNLVYPGARGRRGFPICGAPGCRRESCGPFSYGCVHHCADELGSDLIGPEALAEGPFVARQTLPLDDPRAEARNESVQCTPDTIPANRSFPGENSAPLPGSEPDQPDRSSSEAPPERWQGGRTA